MKVIDYPAWVFYVENDIPVFDIDKVGKWMYFFADRNRVEKLCISAIEQHIVKECKHSNADEGVACFYLEDDDIAGHKKVIEFFIKNDMIRRTKVGKYYNISFKHDSQTDAGEYGVKLNTDIKLDCFLDLSSGKWLE